MLTFDYNFALSEMRENGFVVIPDAVDRMVVADMHVNFDNLFSREQSCGTMLGSTQREETVIWIDHPLAVDKKVLRIALDESLAKLFAEYISTPIQLSYVFSYRTVVDPAITKENQHLYYRSGSFKGWHSDAVLLSKGYRCVVAMLYLTDVSEGDGGLFLVRGSHRTGGKKREWSPDEFDQNDTVEVTGKAGTMVFFDMEMIHRVGTPNNEFSRDIIRFMYSPEGGYSTDYVVPISFFDKDLTPEQMRILGVGVPKQQGIKLSPVRGNDRSSQVSGNRIKYFLKRVISFFRN